MMMGQNSAVRSNVAAVPRTRRNKNATIVASEFYGEAEDFFVEGDGPVDVKEDHFKTSNLKDMTNLERVQHAQLITAIKTPYTKSGRIDLNAYEKLIQD